MRIIAGEHRGRRIEAPPGDSTRPMLDRVRESLFSTLGNLVDDARVLDLFSGGGSLGLEALSRGASYARLVEREASAYATLKRNVSELGYTPEQASTVRGNALSPLSWASASAPSASAPSRSPLSRGGPSSGAPSAGSPPPNAPSPATESAPDTRFDIVFLDPPYATFDDPPSRARLIETAELLLTAHLRPGGVLVLHAPSRTLEGVRVRVPARLDLRPYGSSGLLYFFPESPPSRGRE
jgi:16S rRNA (guanine966-N2)-methyltransferase